MTKHHAHQILQGSGSTLPLPRAHLEVDRMTRAEQIGELQPIALRNPGSSAEIRALLAKHMGARPDHLVCLHPNATREMRETFTRWLDRKGHLETQLTMALAAEENAWQAVSWPGTVNVHDIKNLQKRKSLNAAERGHMGGRPRVENPSKETLQRREQRARKKGEAA